MSWFKKLTGGLKRSSTKISEGVTGIFTKRKLDDETLEELEDLLITTDLGVGFAARVCATLAETRYNKDISDDEVKTVLSDEISKILTPVAKPLDINRGHAPHVILMIGVNGSGKTTTIGKLARQFKDTGKSVMLAAGDTFRAAAIEQLQVWGDRSGVPVVTGTEGSDPASLAFTALDRAKAEDADVLIIDTAGRLQNRTELMEELAKIVRVIKKKDETAPHDVILVLDATTGQNAIQQCKVFDEVADVTGIIMTKLDGSARGGVLVACADMFKLPVHAIGVGEAVDDLQPFDADEFARAIVGMEE